MSQRVARARGASARAEKAAAEPNEAQARMLATWDAFGDTHLPYRLLLLAKIIDRRSAEYVARMNLSLAEWRVMAHIRYFGKLTISQISRNAFVDRAEVCRAAASLEGQGLLRREANPGNKRSQLLELTEEGDALFLIASEGRIVFFQDLCSVLSPAERKAMDSGLRKMALRVLES